MASVRLLLSLLFCSSFFLAYGTQALSEANTHISEQDTVVNKIQTNTNISEQNTVVNNNIQISISLDLKNATALSNVQENKRPCGDKPLPYDCEGAIQCSHASGIFDILVPYCGLEVFSVYCETYIQNWLVIQNHRNGSVDFYRDWDDYENGFGKLRGEFFIGLKKLHALTTFNGRQELLILITTTEGLNQYARYDNFVVGSASESYRLKSVGRYSGTAGDAMSYHVGQKFTTKDRDNDIFYKNCAVRNLGAWWYKDCLRSNLCARNGRCFTWSKSNNAISTLSYSKMFIRPFTTTNISAL